MSISRKAGGLQGAVLSLCLALDSGGSATVDVMGLADEFSADDASLWSPLNPRSFPSVGPRAFGYAPTMLRQMLALAPDVVHCHGLWLYPGMATLSWHSRAKRPYVVSPHGMLERQVEMKKSRLKKTAALCLFQRRHLNRAGCLHALCDAELADIRKMGLRNPVCVIPNGVVPPPLTANVAAPWDETASEGRKVLLYLGRIARKKGLVELLEAISILSGGSRDLLEGWRVIIVGWDKENHQAELERLSQKLQIERYVRFVGPMFGAAKDAAYRNSNAFVLPSMSEGLPLVIPEAWSYELPVIMTPNCNIPQGPAAGAAISTLPTPDALADGLQTLFAMNDAGRREMGIRGRELANANFSWPKIGRQMKEVYQWLAGGGPPPETVTTA